MPQTIGRMLNRGIAVQRIMKSGLTYTAVALASVAASIPAYAQAPAPIAAPSPALAAAPDVIAAYDKLRIQPIWVRGGVESPAIAQLVAILQRAPFDGLPEGPQLAAQVQAAVAQARAAPTTAASADRVISSAWVRYVQALKRPTKGMIYAYPVLRPQGTRTEEILLTAAAAPSLATYLTATSDLNPIYRQLRDTAWAEGQAMGNLTPDPRLLANLDRARSIPARGRFVLVDSGTQRLTLFENAVPVDSMKIIVGTNELPTPLIASMMYYVTYNPYWHAPDMLVKKTIAPNVLRMGPKYLSSRGYHVVDAWSETANVVDASTVDWKAAAAGTSHVFVRQDPGPLNSMGNLKFPFPNPEGIYLHDTPSKQHFAKGLRNLSNGCVRVEDAKRLARWLIGQEPAAPSADPEIRVQLPQGVPVVVTYLTAQVQDGKLTYLSDFYGWDTNGPPRFASSD
jgi:L,D-transpeptidase YcbB